MTMGNPYEYHNNKLGVKANYIYEAHDAHESSLRLISIKGLQQRIQRNAIYRLRRSAPGTPMLLDWRTLPDEWQKELVATFGDPKKITRQSFIESCYERDMAAYETYVTHTFADSTTLSDDMVEEYTNNASALNAVGKVLAERTRTRRSMRLGVADVWETVNNDVKYLKTIVPHTLPENTARLRQKYNQYKKEGYGCLISKKIKNVNARVVTDDIEAFLNALFSDRHIKPSMSEVAKQYDGFLDGYVEVINNETGEMYNPKDFPKISPRTILAYLAKWQNAIGTHTLRGGDRQKIITRFKPYHSLEQPKFAGSIISIDDRQPPFTYGDNKRVWFYNAIDLGSEAFTCWVYGTSKEGIIQDFYQQLVRNYAQWGVNLPAELEGEMSLNSQYADTILKEGNMFQHVRIEANNARGKRIEAYYGQLRYQHEKKRLGWLARPFAIREANQGDRYKKIILPYEEIIDGCLRDIETWNNMEHSKIKGMSRWEVFLKMQHPELTPINYRAIVPYIGERTTTSCHAGIMKLNNTEYLLGRNGLIATGQLLIDYMTQAEGRELEIRWLTGNDGRMLKAYTYHGDRMICEAIRKPSYNRATIEQTPEDYANREMMSKYVETIEGFGRRRRKEIDGVTVIDNRPITISNTFSIAAINRPERVRDYDTGAILPPPNKDFLNAIETPLKRQSMRDRF